MRYVTPKNALVSNFLLWHFNSPSWPKAVTMCYIGVICFWYDVYPGSSLGAGLLLRSRKFLLCWSAPFCPARSPALHSLLGVCSVVQGVRRDTRHFHFLPVTSESRASDISPLVYRSSLYGPSVALWRCILVVGGDLIKTKLPGGMTGLGAVV